MTSMFRRAFSGPFAAVLLAACAQSGAGPATELQPQVASTRGAAAAGDSREAFARLAAASQPVLDGRLPIAGLRDSVSVIRDRWGVPHIYASNTHDLFLAQGFVHAQDRLWQMDMYRRTYEGRLAEILGEDYLEHDRLMRLLRFRGPFDDEEFRSYHPEGRQIFQAFADGVNAFIAQAGDRLPVEFRLTGLKPLPWTADIALLRTQTAMPSRDARLELQLAMDVARIGADSANREANPSPWRELSIPPGFSPEAITPEVLAGLEGARTGTVRPPLLPEYRALADALPSENTGVQENSPGSNNWVISGRLTETGSVLLANDPHRNVANPSIRYLVHLNAPGWNVIGATEAPLPGVAIGHNGRIAWGLTIVGTDQSDVFVEQLNPANREQVRYRGAWEPLRVQYDTISVRGGAPVIVRQQFSRHGPIFHVDSARNLAYSMHSTMHMKGSAGYISALRYHELENCGEFIEAQVYYMAPTENMMCGDVHGNIAWHASGAAPKREGWDGRLPVPGTGEYEWNGLRSDHPREFNPDRGWIATANHDIHPPGFDPPLFFKNGPARARYERIEHVLSSGTPFSMEDMKRLQHDAHSVQGALDIPLFRGWTSRDAQVELARRELAGWDAQHRRESRAAAIYRYAAPGITSEARAPGTPAARRQVLLESAIAMALDSLRNRLGNDPAEWRWGRLNTSQLPHSLVKAYDIAPVERDGGAGFVAAVGATFREIIDLGNLDASMVTNTPGQSARPGSPFYSNLVESYGRGEYFPLVYSREAVESAAAHRLVLTARVRGDG